MKYLIINTGSASKKYALFDGENKVYNAHFEQEDGNYIVTESFSGQTEKTIIKEKFYKQALVNLPDLLIKRGIIQNQTEIEVIGIRVVAPGDYFAIHRVIDKTYLKFAKQALDKVPLHLGPTLLEIKLAQKVFGRGKIIGISDSAFHSTMPERAKYYAIPIADSRRLNLQKFGYHGLSIQSVLKQVKRNNGALASRIVVCHLGGGASVTAVKNGQSVYTSMGFTPLDGLVMATRVGEIDPGAVIYLADKLKLNSRKLEDYFNNRCGLLGLSGKSSDVRELLKLESQGDQDSALALEIYADRLKKYIGSAVAVLGGIDLLVFAGTVGERSFIMRERICQGLEFLGFKFDKNINDKSEGVEAKISQPDSVVGILVIKTDETAEMIQVLKEVLITEN